jgi:hypothetical protein
LDCATGASADLPGDAPDNDDNPSGGRPPRLDTLIASEEWFLAGDEPEKDLTDIATPLGEAVSAQALAAVLGRFKVSIGRGGGWLSSS